MSGVVTPESVTVIRWSYPLKSVTPFVIAYEPPLEQSIKSAENLKFQGKYKEAVAAYERLIAKNPNNVDVRIGLFKLQFFFEKHEEALPEINKALKIFTARADLFYLKGTIFQKREGKANFLEAVKYFKQALSQLQKIKSGKDSDELSKDIYRSLGLAFTDLGDYTTGESYIQKSIGIDKSYQRALFALAMNYQARNINGYYDRSKEIYQRIDQKKIQEEMAKISCKDFEILQDRHVIEEALAQANAHNINNPEANFDIVKNAILYQNPSTMIKNTDNRILELANLYWQTYIKYVPDNSNGKKGDTTLPPGVFKEPRISAKEQFGDCDDAAMMFSTILKEASIENKMIMYRYGSHSKHVICAFKLDMGWGYIDINGLNILNCKTLTELLKKLEIKPTKGKAQIVDITGRQIIITKEININF